MTVLNQFRLTKQSIRCVINFKRVGRWFKLVAGLWWCDNWWAGSRMFVPSRRGPFGYTTQQSQMPLTQRLMKSIVMLN